MRTIKLLLAISVAAASTLANAAVDFSTIRLTSGQFTPWQRAQTATFDSAPPADVYYTGGEYVTGTAPDQHYTAPDYDATQYLIVGANAPTARITFGYRLGATYFGFYFSTIDAYNSVTFHGSDGSLTTITGQQIQDLVPGSRASYYFNVFATGGTTFDWIELRSPSDSFETDNHAFMVAEVPEPETYAMLLSCLGLVGAITRRRARGGQ
jgi:hypothetical protein